MEFLKIQGWAETRGPLQNVRFSESGGVGGNERLGVNQGTYGRLICIKRTVCCLLKHMRSKLTLYSEVVFKQRGLPFYKNRLIC